jgi:thiol-disulfide isomerase/thioredoxin
MPLIPLSFNEPISPSHLNFPTFLIFYASIDDEGKMWCSDCRDLDPLIQKVIQENDISNDLISLIYVGDKPV